MDLARLISNLQAAKQPSRILDCQIAEVIGWTSRVEEGKTRWFPPNSNLTAVVPSFSKNIQAAYDFYVQMAPSTVGAMKWTPSAGAAQIEGEPAYFAPNSAMALCLAAAFYRAKGNH